MIRILSLPSAARAALNYTPPHALTSGTRFISLNAIVNTVSGGSACKTEGADKLLAKVMDGKRISGTERAQAVLDLGGLKLADIPVDNVLALSAALGLFAQDISRPALAFASAVALNIWSSERTFIPIDFPNAVYERLPGRIKVLAAKRLAARWGYDHVYVRHIMSAILGKRDDESISAAIQEFRTAGIEATIFLPELMTLYATPSIHGLQALLRPQTMQDLETTISIMSGAIVYALTSHLRELQNAWQDTDAARGVLRRIERRAEPAPHLAAWLIPYLKEISQRQNAAHGKKAALWTDTTIRKLERWNGEARQTKRMSDRQI